MLSGVPPASMAGSRARNPRRGREREEDVGLSFQGKRYVYVTRFSQSSTQLLYSRRNADAETKPISDRQSTKKLLYSFSGDHRYLPRPHLLCCAWCLFSITLIVLCSGRDQSRPHRARHQSFVARHHSPNRRGAVS